MRDTRLKQLSLVPEMKADRETISRLLKTAKGQVEGIIKMVEEDRYCIDISNQILAATSILNRVNQEIIRAHMKNCVKEAFHEGLEDEKIDEIVALLGKITK
jgi:CsoR family transcriptional regulator, copper-sensing transcriptional repressor